ncbi:probable salivary secreted peptide isoform X1 [Spodoptera frugiperda]|uniref:Probable salivary secreted peptide isoform X1 n=1 Tax=Spodoptera frugiperda TaxID=7108 RepID=A0A9R0DSU8_SPOFR|nr:probable salivary secreted peptide isoform X1 [Spodoptera frugiperda]XP_050552306.1 probable salivary secreted peptide isoform X1 [Spodoptera frugiperda]
MKSLFLVVLLAAAATAAIVSQDVAEAPEGVVEYEEILYSDEAEMAEVEEAGSRSMEIESRRNLSVGTIGNSRLLANTQHIRGAVANTIIVQNITFNFASSIRIAAIRVTRVGASQNATPSIVSGGLNRNFVTIRITSARGRGYNYRIQIYGR